MVESILAMIFFLNEASRRDVAGDVEAFRTIEALANYIEIPDVLNGNYWVFDSDGYFYDITLTGERSTAFRKRTEFTFQRTEFHPDLALDIVKQALENVKREFDRNTGLEEIGELLIERG